MKELIWGYMLYPGDHMPKSVLQSNRYYDSFCQWGHRLYVARQKLYPETL